jgi:hypothetical protein|tara:strand:- start:154 stop:372 length:219 start_codon:yes stop_codon:yes gene_type:complete
MAQQSIKFTIRQDGTVTEEVMGVVGPNCEKLTQRIEDKLGNVLQREQKPSYYQQAVVAEELVEEFTHDSEGC